MVSAGAARFGELNVRLYTYGTWRTVPPSETLSRIVPLLPGAGITRLADLTGLDRVGLPVYQAVRPNSRNLAVAQGKGLTRPQARVSALMESLESFHAEEITQPTTRATVAAMRREIDYDPFELELAEPRLLTEATPLDWVPARDLVSGAQTWVPRQLCELNYSADLSLFVRFFRPSSNGLASGNTRAEALLHGLSEVIERDSSWRNRAAKSDPGRVLAPETISSGLARQVLGRFASAGLTATIVDVTGPTALPAFEVLLDEPGTPARYLGAGCHPRRATALLRALTEAAQSRLTHIAGSRDDINRSTYLDAAWPERKLRGPVRVEQRCVYGEVSQMIPRGFEADLQEIARRVRAVTGMSPLAVDLQRPAFGLPVVFVVAPGLRRDHHR